MGDRSMKIKTKIENYINNPRPCAFTGFPAETDVVVFTKDPHCRLKTLPASHRYVKGRDNEFFKKELLPREAQILHNFWKIEMNLISGQSIEKPLTRLMYLWDLNRASIGYSENKHLEDLDAAFEAEMEKHLNKKLNGLNYK